jgi:hypothetical protein
VFFILSLFYSTGLCASNSFAVSKCSSPKNKNTSGTSNTCGVATSFLMKVSSSEKANQEKSDRRRDKGVWVGKKRVGGQGAEWRQSDNDV